MNIVLHDEGSAEELNIEEIARYLAQKLGKVKIEVKGNPFHHLPSDTVPDFAGQIARTKIQQINKEIAPEQEPFPAELEFEKRRLLGMTKAFGVPYDGFQLVRIFAKVIPAEEYRRQFTHIVFTNRLLATWDKHNQRYHLRTSIYAMPSIISATGLIEAPARPREYYLLKQQYERLGKDLAELKGKFDFLDYGDKRLTEVAKGYAMQAVFYSLTGNPFCEDRGCRLYNAHWQEELIFAQLKSGYELCPRHTKLLEKLRALV